MQLGEIESYLCVASEFVQGTRITFIIVGKKGYHEVKEGLCRLRGGRKCVRGSQLPGVPSDPHPRDQHPASGSTHGVSSGSLLGALGGDVLSSRSVLCAG